jgi:hypothetical protein
MKKLFILSLFVTCTLSSAGAQEISAVSPADSAKVSGDTLKMPADTLKMPADTVKTTADTQKVPADKVKISKNFIKFNITSAIIKNYSLQYERVLSRGVSMALSFRMMPESGIPYTDKIFKWFDITDPETQVIINNTIVGNYAITPEIRFYTGKKKYGNGFYFALFYRYGHYTVKNALIPYDTDGGDQVTLTTSGNVSAHTGGFMLGAQWALGRHICLDWWILGPQFGVSSGDMISMSSGPLSPVDQQDIADNLNSIDIPMFDQTVNVTSDKVSMVFDGPWAGIRAALSLGVKF